MQSNSKIELETARLPMLNTDNSNDNNNNYINNNGIIIIIVIIITVCLLSLLPLVNCRSRNARTYMISCTGLYQAFDFQASY